MKVMNLNILGMPLEVRYDLGPSQYMVAGWVPEGESLTRQPEPRYRVKRGRGGRRKRGRR